MDIVLWYSTTQDSTNDSFLKVNGGGIWNHINDLFTYCYIEIQSSYTLNGYLTHLIHIDFLENIGWLCYANVANVETFYTISKKSY